MLSKYERQEQNMSGTVLAAIDGAQAFKEPKGERWPASQGPLITYLDPLSPSVNTFDLSVIRGDGIFEATSTWGDDILALRIHQQRLAHSAQLCDLPEPNQPVFFEALHAIYAHYRDVNAPNVQQANIRWLISRGSDGSTTPGSMLHPGIPTIRVYVDERNDDPLDPIPLHLILLQKGVSSDAASKQPWMLWGAKTLSYAMNMAAYREAKRRGADNVIFSSTEGNILEGPTSSIAWIKGNDLFTPVPDQGILYGTTQREFFAFASHKGLATHYGRFPVQHLDNADAIFMLGGSMISPVISYNGKSLVPIPGFAGEANMFMRTHRSFIDKFTATHSYCSSARMETV
jgi:4-amino-4-deoxychorismate lyase